MKILLLVILTTLTLSGCVTMDDHHVVQDAGHVSHQGGVRCPNGHVTNGRC